MSMSKQDFIALAQAIKEHNRMLSTSDTPFTPEHLATLASFCKSQNSAFMRERWMGYITDQNGPSGGSIKPKFKVPAGKKIHKFATMEDARAFCNGYFETSGVVLTILAI